MYELPAVRVLLVEDNRDFAELVQLFLKRHAGANFSVEWRANGTDALRAIETIPDLDIILMDYFLPGKNGLEVAREIREQGIVIPVVFLTVNKDFDLAVEVLKLGVEDYLVKEEISTPVLPRTILSVIERRKLRDELTSLEISQKRLQIIQELVVKITTELRSPMDGMRVGVDGLLAQHGEDNLRAYLVIIRDNLIRIEKKMTRLRELKTDKTIPYIRDIRMLDLSDEAPLS
jgi:sigma-B regulation protein RsbU (phosphoserine phosphatase)